jgi:hypothetical protein
MTALEFVTLFRMSIWRRLAQSLGLVYRDDGTWRPVGARRPPSSQDSKPADSPDDPPN